LLGIVIVTLGVVLPLLFSKYRVARQDEKARAFVRDLQPALTADPRFKHVGFSIYNGILHVTGFLERPKHRADLEALIRSRSPSIKVHWRTTTVSPEMLEMFGSLDAMMTDMLSSTTKPATQPAR
jgi:ribosomal protein S19